MHRQAVQYNRAPLWSVFIVNIILALTWAACAPADSSGGGGLLLGSCVGEDCEDDGILGPSGSNSTTPTTSGASGMTGGAEPDAGGVEADTGAIEPDQDTGAVEPDTNEADTDIVEPDTSEPEPDTPEPGACIGDERQVQKVYYGTLEPTYLPMTEGQILAVGNFYGCTGTLIAPNWVLSASHCNHSRGATICFGSDPSDANICFRAINVYEPSADMSLLELEADVTREIPGITPIPLLTEDMDNTWIGRTAEAAGYGQMENGRSGTRKFTAEPIVRLRSETVTIDGEGERGVCFGDSGGPLMVIASDGTVRISGVLSNGDGSCVGQDNYTRVDTFRDWIEGYTGPTIVDGAACDDIDGVGRCLNGQALWCDDDVLRSDPCTGATSCGWDGGAQGYRCVLGDNPCQGLDNFGVCDGQTALWCDEGELRRRDCGSCDQVCAIQPQVNGVYCEDDPCRGLDYYGRCDGDVVEYCDNGEYQTVNCAAEGQECVWYNDRVGYWCY